MVIAGTDGQRRIGHRGARAALGVGVRLARHSKFTCGKIGARGFLLLALLVPQIAGAAIEPYQEYDKRISALREISALGTDIFGDEVNLFNGQTTFSNVDVSLKGNNLIPLEVRRTFRVERDPQDVAYKKFGGLGNWEIDVPYIVGTYPSSSGWASDRCTNPSIPSLYAPWKTGEIWQGNTVHLPGRGDLTMFKSTASSRLPMDVWENPWTTSDFSAVTCTNTPDGQGQGFVVHTPDGLSYTFNRKFTRSSGRMRKSWMANGLPVEMGKIRVYLLVSSIHDRFGNQVTYQYDGNGYPTSISSTDGRSVTLTYNAGRLSTVRAGAAGSDQVWGYGYVAGRLDTVSQPDGTFWKYTYAGSTQIDPQSWDGNMRPGCVEHPPEDGGLFSLGVIHPMGAAATFDFEHKRHFRSGVSTTHCSIVTHSGVQSGSTYELNVPAFYDVFSLANKRVTGTGIGQQDWTYTYGGLRYALCGTAGLCPTHARRKITSVLYPDGRQKRFHYGVLFGINEGRLLATFVRDVMGTAVRADTMEYVTDEQAASSASYPNLYGMGMGLENELSNKVRPARKTVISQDGAIVEPPQDPAPPAPPVGPPIPPPPPPPPPCTPGPGGDCDVVEAIAPGHEDRPMVVSGTTNVPVSYTKEIVEFDRFARPVRVEKSSSSGL